jgi:hypothetical protein
VQEGEAETTLLRRPAAVILSAEAGVTFHGSRATFAVQNLSNHSYMEPMSFLTEAGRTYALSIRRDLDLPLSAHR